MELPSYFNASKRVVMTLLFGGLTRKECMWILRCSKDTIDNHVETLMKLEKEPSYSLLLCSCVQKKWIRKLTQQETDYYRRLADINEKKFAVRRPEEEIEWQKYDDELYK